MNCVCIVVLSFIVKKCNCGWVNFELGEPMEKMAAAVPSGNSKQTEVSLNPTAPVQPLATPMEVSGSGQMDLKALLEDHILEHPLESAFHG